MLTGAQLAHETDWFRFNTALWELDGVLDTSDPAAQKTSA